MIALAIVNTIIAYTFRKILPKTTKRARTSYFAHCYNGGYYPYLCLVDEIIAKIDLSLLVLSPFINYGNEPVIQQQTYSQS